MRSISLVIKGALTADFQKSQEFDSRKS